jgi:nicotinamidase/pyrazinamidase
MSGNPTGPESSSRRSALLIVDVQNDFCPGGALAVPDGDRVVERLNHYIANAESKGRPIYASRDWHPSVTNHFKPFGGQWPVHCVRGTLGAGFHPDLRLPASTIVITKGEDPTRHGYSVFEGTTPEGRSFVDDLRARHVDHLLVGGLATDYCVRASVLDALARSIRVTILEDAIAGVDLEQGDSERALAEMRSAGAECS